MITTERQRKASIAKWLLLLVGALCAISLAGQTAPSRTDAQYIQVYSDDIEALAPAIGEKFLLGPAGSLTTNVAEIFSGTGSIKGSYSGANMYTSYLETRLSSLQFTPNETYRVTFNYRILTTPSLGFEVLFYSQTAANQSNFLPSISINGAAGTTGSATLTNTLNSFSDYRAIWNIKGTGSIAIDDIHIVQMPSQQSVATENGELQLPSPGAGLQLLNGARTTIDPSMVVAGNGSIRLPPSTRLSTDPAVIELLPNTAYILELDYRVLDPGGPLGTGSYSVLDPWLHPVGDESSASLIPLFSLLKNAASSGTFSTGAQTAGSPNYVLKIASTSASDVVIDNIRLLRRTTVQSSAPPSRWSRLESVPYPRLGKYQAGSLDWMTRPGEVPYGTSFQTMAERLAFADVIVGLNVDSQTRNDTHANRLIRQINPNAVILPYRITAEQEQNVFPPTGQQISPQYQFFQGLSNDWYVKNTSGVYVTAPLFPQIRAMNIYPPAPVAGGHTYFSYLLQWLRNDVLSSGVWDGMFFDNMFARTNPHIPNAFNYTAFDFDYNRNGIKDETPAGTTESTRSAVTGFLQQFHIEHGELQLIVGNTGTEPSLRTLQNGQLYECFNAFWEKPSTPKSPAEWRTQLETYLQSRYQLRSPKINVVEGCSRNHNNDWSQYYPVPTADDIASHRFTLGTALLGDGFYSFDINGALTAPYWYDEYSVNANGVAVEDRSKKGYLGQALADAVELSAPGTLIFQDDYEYSSVPSYYFRFPSPGIASVSNGQLVITNPTLALSTVAIDPTLFSFPAGYKYLVEFDWQILATLDSGTGGLQTEMLIQGVPNSSLDRSSILGGMTGDSGTARFPFTISTSAAWMLRFTKVAGRGSIAIDNLRVYRGKGGPWRRDFENGFVLVNPFNEPYTFTPAELAGAFQRTGIRRILGTQAPTVNTGQAVTGSLTLQPFDAIILLANRLRTNGRTQRYGQLTSQ